eukprot:778307-Alexandrium_andersonii.AAC.1
MSASLVGSEMCIRDRPAAEARLVTLTKGMPLGALRAWAVLHGVVRTVSYTHLTLPTICSV